MSGLDGAYAGEIRRAVERALRIDLPDLTKRLYGAWNEGRLTEAEVAALDALIRERQRASRDRRDLPRAGDAVPVSAAAPVRRWGSRPRTPESLERRRRWAASGRLPPALAARFTPGEQAVLSLVAAETARRKDCRLAVGHLAAIAGVSETTVRNAIREARTLGLVTVEERQITGFRNDTNIVRIVSPEWTAWLRLARRSPAAGADRPPAVGGGCKSAKGTPTQVLDLGESRPAEPPRGASGGRMAGPSSPRRPAARSA